MKRGGWWGAGIVLLVLALGLVWSQRDRRIFVRALQPDYLVTQVNPSVQTMVVQKANHRYLVNCGQSCSSFLIGKTYPMRMVVNALEFRETAHPIILPILREDVTFPADGGRG